jgi:hypothetical protein
VDGNDTADTPHSAFIFAILRATSLSLGLSDTTYDYTLTGTWMTQVFPIPDTRQ